MTIAPAGSMKKISLDHLTIDPERFIVIKEDSVIALTKTEFLILYLMMSTKGKIQTRADISRFAWGSEVLENPRTIDTHISNIRKKVGKVKERAVISVIKGVGYKLDDVLNG
ncbi:MAG: winged helix-turn-helix transcriptional regulator [Bacteroidetes bacterium]|nr:winged helix-turn-helix transcriptional regulator [Bacteroidota bacterium]